MSYDGVFTCAMVHELKENLTLGKIEKIYQPQPEQLLFIIHTSNGKKKLFLSAAGNHSAVYLVEETPENPVSPPVFCMVLRKHLNSARITDILQHENDRIIEFMLETVDELGFNVNRKLIVEIMGKHSNILLVDMQSGKIIDSIKHVGIDVNRARQILPGKIYEYPPAQTKIPFTEITEDSVHEIVREQLQADRAILNGIQGISPALATSLVLDSEDDIDGRVLPSRLYDAISNMCADITSGKFTPVVYTKADKPSDFHAFALKLYDMDSSYTVSEFQSLSEAASYYFVNRESSNTIKQKSNDMLRVVKAQQDKLKLKIQRLNEDLYKAENSDKYRLFGELLTANLHLVKPGAKEVTVKSYYDGSEVKIPLDPKFSSARNAQNYYKRYGKAKTAIKEKKLQLDEANSELEYLDSVSSFVEIARSIEELELLREELVESGYLRYHARSKSARRNSPKKKSKPKPISYILSSGKAVLVGRNNNENDWLTFKKASSNDIWFHTKDIPGSHVILVTNGEPVTEEELFETASIAALHSKGLSSENVPVDYTKARYVKKPSGSKPGFVIFTHNKTLYVNPGAPEQI